MVHFKIIEGYYKNITYNSNSVYSFDGTKIKRGNIRFISTDDNALFENHLNSNIGFEAKYIGISRIDSCPMFSIDENDLRNNRIDTLLS
jgi:hypothetical protein